MFAKLDAVAPDGSVQLKRKSDAPSVPSVKATPSVTEYLFWLTSVVTACTIGVSMRKLNAIQYWINRGYVLFFIKMITVSKTRATYCARRDKFFFGQPTKRL